MKIHRVLNKILPIIMIPRGYSTKTFDTYVFDLYCCEGQHWMRFYSRLVLNDLLITNYYYNWSAKAHYIIMRAYPK